MKFVIDTTDGSDDKPCKNAELIGYSGLSYSFTRDENDIPIAFEKFKNLECWAIELNSLEDILKLNRELSDKYEAFNGLIFFPENHESGLPEIEIYIGYRE